jgi:hypothetical protein
VSPGLPQKYSPFFSIQCHTPPGLHTQDSNVLTHTFFHLSLGLPTFLVPSGLVLNIFLMIVFLLARAKCPAHSSPFTFIYPNITNKFAYCV